MKKSLQNIIKISILSFLTLFLIPLNGNADERSEEIKVYQKFFEINGSKAQYEQSLDLFINQFQLGFGQRLSNSQKKIEGTPLEDKEKLFRQAMNNLLEELRVEIPKVMPFEELVKEIYIPVYSKHFSIKDIKKIISFFESPTGHKFIQNNPAIMQESMKIINQKYAAKLREVGGKIGAREGAKIDRELKKIANKQ